MYDIKWFVETKCVCGFETYYLLFFQSTFWEWSWWDNDSFWTCISYIPYEQPLTCLFISSKLNTGQWYKYSRRPNLQHKEDLNQIWTYSPVGCLIEKCCHWCGMCNGCSNITIITGTLANWNSQFVIRFKFAAIVGLSRRCYDLPGFRRPGKCKDKI